MTEEEAKIEWAKINKLYDDILNLKSYTAISTILNGLVLEGFQSSDLVRSLFFRKFIFSYDTGLGKTLMACAWMMALRNQDPSRRFIFFVKNNQLAQTPQKIMKATGLRIVTSTGEASALDKKIFRNDLEKYDVVMLTHSCLDNAGVLAELYENRDRFFGVIVDEAHAVSNIQGSKAAFSLMTLLNYYDWALALTATPMKISVSELINLMYIVHREAIPDIKTCEGLLMTNGVTDFKDVIVVRTRADLGIMSEYIPKIHFVHPTEAQRGASGRDMFFITKGKGAYPQAFELIKTIKEYRPRRGIIFIHHHEVREGLLEYLDKTDIDYACLNGKSSDQEIMSVCEEFNRGEHEIIITSLTDALDLDCDYVVFYEFTVDFKQLIGRAERGLNPKTLYIHYIFTLDTDESEYFYRNVYLRSLLTRTILGQDVNHIIKAMRRVANLDANSKVEPMKSAEEVLELDLF